MSYEEDRQFHQVVNEGLVPKILDSKVCVSLAPAPDQVDAKFAVELGVMIMLDKPILTVVTPGQVISKKLEMVSDRIVHADIQTDEGCALLMEAARDLIREHGL